MHATNIENNWSILVHDTIKNYFLIEKNKPLKIRLYYLPPPPPSPLYR